MVKPMLSTSQHISVHLSAQKVFAHSALCEVNVALQQVGEFHQAFFLPWPPLSLK